MPKPSLRERLSLLSRWAVVLGALAFLALTVVSAVLVVAFSVARAVGWL